MRGSGIDARILQRFSFPLPGHRALCLGPASSEGGSGELAVHRGCAEEDDIPGCVPSSTFCGSREGILPPFLSTLLMASRIMSPTWGLYVEERDRPSAVTSEGGHQDGWEQAHMSREERPVSVEWPRSWRRESFGGGGKGVAEEEAMAWGISSRGRALA